MVRQGGDLNFTDMTEIDFQEKRLNIFDLRPCDHIGFIDDDGHKGYLVYVGDVEAREGESIYNISAVSLRAGDLCVPNTSYGVYSKNKNTSVSGALSIQDRTYASIKAAYKFNSIQALHRWLGEE